MYSKGIFSTSSLQKAQSSSIVMGSLWKTLFYSRLQTFSITLISGEIGGQFSRLSNTFSKTKSLKESKYVHERLLAAIFSPTKQFWQKIFLENWQKLDLFLCSTNFFKHFQPPWALKPQSFKQFPPSFQVSDKSSLPFRYWVNDRLKFVC